MSEINQCQKCGADGHLSCGLNDMYEIICEAYNCDNHTENTYIDFEDAIKEWNMKK